MCVGRGVCVRACVWSVDVSYLFYVIAGGDRHAFNVDCKVDFYLRQSTAQ